MFRRNAVPRPPATAEFLAFLTDPSDDSGSDGRPSLTDIRQSSPGTAQESLGFPPANLKHQNNLHRVFSLRLNFDSLAYDLR
jgi:hypothetical protein